MHPVLRGVAAAILIACGLYLLWLQVRCGLSFHVEECSISGVKILGEIAMIAMGVFLVRYGPDLTEEVEGEDF